MVEVGKLLRDKYLNPESPFYDPDFFKGQAAPEHTQAEAWQLMVAGIEEGKAKHHTIFIDGQPRDIQQCNDIHDQYACANYLVQFAHVYAPSHIRTQRAESRDSGDPAKLELSRRRMQGDLIKLYEVITRLINHGSTVLTICNDGEKTMAAIAHQVLTWDWQTDAPFTSESLGRNQ